jgi:hypothetical protein
MSNISVKNDKSDNKIMKKIQDEIKDYIISKFLTIIISQSKEIKYLKNKCEEFKKQAINVLKKIMYNDDKNTLSCENDNKSHSKIDIENSISVTNISSPNKKSFRNNKKVSGNKKSNLLKNNKVVSLKTESNLNKRKLVNDFYCKTEGENFEKNMENNLVKNKEIRNDKNYFFYSPKFTNQNFYILSDNLQNKISSIKKNKNLKKENNSGKKIKIQKENSNNSIKKDKSINSRNINKNSDSKNSISYLTKTNNNENITNFNIYNSTILEQKKNTQTISINNRLCNSVGKNCENNRSYKDIKDIKRLSLNQKSLKTINNESLNHSLNTLKSNKIIRKHSFDVRNNNVKEYKNILSPNYINQKIIKVISNNSNKGLNLDPEFMSKMNFYLQSSNK